MKKNLLKNTIIAGTLCTMLVTPTFGQGGKTTDVMREDIKIIPISHQFKHWAEGHIHQLSQNYDVQWIFQDKDLDTAITAEDFQKLLQSTVDEKYDKMPDSMKREAVIYEVTRIWAEKTGKDLQKIPTIRMIIYPDTDKIDPKYNQGITVAYMKGIAKGRATGNFDPKTEVTYGEAAVLMTKLEKAIQNEFVEEDGISEGSFETKGSYQIKDDKVVFDFQLINHHQQPKKLQLGSGQQFEVVITDEDGKEVYRYSDDKFFTLALVYETLQPGESLQWQDEWDKTNKEGEKLTSGNYKAEIRILAIEEDKAEEIPPEEWKTEIEFSL